MKKTDPVVCHDYLLFSVIWRYTNQKKLKGDLWRSGGRTHKQEAGAIPFARVHTVRKLWQQKLLTASLESSQNDKEAYGQIRKL
jgi:hypothetical protein